MTIEEIKAENREIYRLMAWSLAYVVLASAAMWVSLWFARHGATERACWPLLVASIVTFARGFFLSLRVSERARTLNAAIERRIAEIERAMREALEEGAG